MDNPLDNVGEEFGEYDFDWNLKWWQLLIPIVVLLCLYAAVTVASRWKVITGTLLVVGITLFGYHAMNWDGARLVVSSICFGWALLSYVIPQGQMENENCRTTTVLELWKRQNIFQSQMKLAAVAVFTFLVGAGFVELFTDSTVYWTGAIAVCFACPLVMLGIGYLTIRSHWISPALR